MTQSERYWANPAMVEHKGGFAKDPELQKRASAKGRATSNANRKQRALIRSALKSLLQAELTSSGIDAELSQRLTDIGITLQNQAAALSMAMLEKAKNGSVEAATFVRDTAGEKPVTGIDLDATAEPVDGLDLSALSEDELREMIAERDELPAAGDE